MIQVGRFRSEPVVFLAQRVFVFVAGPLGDKFGVVDVETGIVPFFHLDHGVIFVSESFFGADGGDPGVDGLPIVVQELIKV
jgi:hypothetical protein